MEEKNTFIFLKLSYFVIYCNKKCLDFSLCKMEITFHFHCFFSIYSPLCSTSFATDSYLLFGILFHFSHKLISVDFFSLQFFRWTCREGNKSSQDTSHWVCNWYMTNPSCTISEWAIDLNLTSEVLQKLAPYLPVKK